MGEIELLTCSVQRCDNPYTLLFEGVPSETVPGNNERLRSCEKFSHFVVISREVERRKLLQEVSLMEVDDLHDLL